MSACVGKSGSSSQNSSAGMNIVIDLDRQPSRSFSKRKRPARTIKRPAAPGGPAVGGTVGSVTNSNGNVFLYADDFPTVSKFTGNIVIKTGSGQYRGRTYSVQ